MPQRLVVDTNILISLFMGRQSAELIEAIVNEDIVLISSREQISEIKRVLAYPKLAKHFTPEIRDDIVFLVATMAELVLLANDISDCRDPKDNFILEMAVNGKADFIVSGDEDIRSLNPYRGVSILDLNEFKKKISMDKEDIPSHPSPKP